MLRENASATAVPCLENPMAKHFNEQNLLEEMVHTSPFISSEPILLGVLESFEEYDSEDSLHSHEDCDTLGVCTVELHLFYASCA